MLLMSKMAGLPFKLHLRTIKMKKLTTFAAAAVLAVAAGQASAATINVTGSMTDWDTTPATTTYPTTGAPAFTGTYDDVSGAFNFSFTDFEAHVDVFGLYIADIATTGQTLAAGSGAGASLVTKTGSSICTGSSVICDDQPTADIFLDGANTWNGTTGTMSTTQATAGGVSLATYTFTEVAEVPLPAAAWLFGSGLIGLVGVARRKRS